MSHRDYSPLVDEHAEIFDVADEAMTASVMAALEGKITATAAEAGGFLASKGKVTCKEIFGTGRKGE